MSPPYVLTYIDSAIARSYLVARFQHLDTEDGLPVLIRGPRAGGLRSAVTMVREPPKLDSLILASREETVLVVLYVNVLYRAAMS